MAQTNPRVRNYPINAQGGLMTNIPLTMLCSKVSVIEDPSLNNGQFQGLQGYYIDNTPPQPAIPIEAGGAAPPQADPQALQTWLPPVAGVQGQAYEPINFGGADGRVHGGEGDYVGGAGTVILQLTSASANSSGVIVTEWP